MEEQKHDVEIDLKIDGNGKIHLHLDEQNFELSGKSARYLAIRLKKVLKLKWEYDFFHKKSKNETC